METVFHVRICSGIFGNKAFYLKFFFQNQAQFLTLCKNFVTLSGGEIPSRVSKLCFTFPAETFEKTNVFVQNSLAFFLEVFATNCRSVCETALNVFRRTSSGGKALVCKFLFQSLLSEFEPNLSEFGKHFSQFFQTSIFVCRGAIGGWLFFLEVSSFFNLPSIFTGNFSNLWREYYSRVQCCPCFVPCVHLEPLSCFSWKFNTFCS